MVSKYGLFVGLALLASVVPRTAQSAEPTAEEKETARGMMDEGHARRAAGNHVGALEQFRGADAIMHVPTTGLEAAREQIALGQFVEARDTLLRVIRAPSNAQESEAFLMARKSAQALDDELSKRIAALNIAIRGAPVDASMQVTVDGLPIPSAALVAPFKVNPGHHVVTATTAASTARVEVDVGDAETAAVSLTLSPSRSLQESATQESHVVPSDATAGVVRDESTSPSVVPWLRWGGFGLAIAGVGVGSVTGAMSMTTTNSVRKSCVAGRCPLSSSADLDSARTMAMISNVSFAAAGVGCALGVVSLFIAGSPAPSIHPTTAGVHVTAWIGSGDAGIRGTF
jgi:hypothetical protein